MLPWLLVDEQVALMIPWLLVMSVAPVTMVTCDECVAPVTMVTLMSG